MSEADTGLTTPDIVKEFLNITTGTHDTLIERLIRQATGEIEDGIGAKIAKAEYTDTLSGSDLGALVVFHAPVIEFLSLLLNGTEVDSDTYDVTLATGVIKLVDSGAVTAWVAGTNNYVANYTAGYAVIPAGLEGIATDIVSRRTLASTKDRIGQSGQGLPTGGFVDLESRDITDAEWKKLQKGWGRRF